MNVLLTGASGFIGRHLQYALEQEGHHVRPVSRQHGFNFKNLLTVDDWLPHLESIDAVINSVGIIAETRGQSFEQLHYQAPVALFDACHQSGIKRVIQISALGADDSAFTPYQLSKKAADDSLRQLPLDWFILRPSLVYGKGGASYALFQRLASLPLIPLVGHGKQKIQPVHISDVVASVMQALGSNVSQQTIDVVGPTAVTFIEWLQSIRLKQGRNAALTLPVPFSLMRSSAQIMRFMIPMLHPDNLRMLQAGNTADVAPLADFLGRMPLSIEETA